MPALNECDYNDLYPLKIIKNKLDYKLALKSLEAVFDQASGSQAEYGVLSEKTYLRVNINYLDYSAKPTFGWMRLLGNNFWTLDHLQFG